MTEPFGPSKVIDPYVDSVGEWLSNTPGEITKLYHIVGTEETPSKYFEIGLYAILPGERVPVHVHERGEEFVYMKKGKAILITEDDHEIGEILEQKLVYVPATAPHGYVNHTDQPIELIVWTSKEAGLKY